MIKPSAGGGAGDLRRGRSGRTQARGSGRHHHLLGQRRNGSCSLFPPDGDRLKKAQALGVHPPSRHSATKPRHPSLISLV